MAGPPDMQLAPWPSYDDQQIAAVGEVLRSGKVNYWTGQYCADFEQAFARYTGTRYAIATANGTLALELALYALGVGEGDEVIVPARTFVGTASSVVARGAVPVFADVDPISGNLTVQTIAPLLSTRTRAVIAVHLNGWPANMPELMAFAEGRALYVIEDCAQAHGAAIADRRVGSFGHLAAFSFCQDKIISTGGEGGMLVCNQPDFFARAWSYKDHGKRLTARDPAPVPGYRWVHAGPGSNYRMTEMQAVLGLLQLRRLQEWNRVRTANARHLNLVLADWVDVPLPPPALRHAFYRFAFHLPVQYLARREALLTALQAAGVPVSTGSCPALYREQAMADFPLRCDCPGAEHHGRAALYLPVHPTLSYEQLDRLATTVAGVLRTHM